MLIITPFKKKGLRTLTKTPSRPLADFHPNYELGATCTSKQRQTSKEVRRGRVGFEQTPGQP